MILDGGFTAVDTMQHSSFRGGEKMIKICLALIACMFTMGSCASVQNITARSYDEESSIKKTVGEMVSAIQQRDKIAFAELFSMTARENTDEFLSKVNEVFYFIQGDIIAFGSTPGVAVDSDYDYGKKRTVVYASYWLETEEHKYYLAICEYMSDTFDEKNVGVKSIYLIDADEWKEDYEYGGDGNWTLGINIDRGNRDG